MRIQITALLVLLLSLGAFAEVDNTREMNDLFRNYDKVMQQHKVELVDEVFTQKFLKENGGKEDFIAKVQELPKQKKTLKTIFKNFKRSKVGRVFFAKVKSEEQKAMESQFVIIEEDGKLKIDGTLSDAD